MGHTHHWTRNERVFGYDEFLEVAKACKKVCEASKVSISMELDSAEPPIFTKDKIRFNGRGDDGAETFLVDRVDPEAGAFCKTYQRPYDICVAACLVILRDKLKFDVHTDDRNRETGEDPGLAAGEALVKKVLKEE